MGLRGAECVCAMSLVLLYGRIDLQLLVSTRVCSLLQHCPFVEPEVTLGSFEYILKGKPSLSPNLPFLVREPDVQVEIESFYETGFH